MYLLYINIAFASADESVAVAPKPRRRAFGGWQKPTKRHQRRTETLNDWDRDVNWNAHTDEFMCGWESWHSNHHEDRKHRMFACSWNAYKNELSPMKRGHTYESGWCNDWDKSGHCQCRPGYAMTGVHSKHDNHKEDRRWKIRCSKINGLRVTNSCRWTGVVNKMDKHLAYREHKSDLVMTGISSAHRNHEEDRYYRFKVCAIQVPRHVCEDIQIKITDFTPMTVGNPRKVAGAEWTNDNCDGETTVKSTLTKSMSTSVASSSTYTLQKSFTSTFNFGISQKATATISAKFAGFGGKFSSSFGIKSSWGTSNMNSKTSSTTRKTIQVETLSAGIEVAVKPHTRSVVKSNYRLYNGFIKWSGEASCYIGGKVVETKAVKGAWRGKAASVTKGAYKISNEKCGGIPPVDGCVNTSRFERQCPQWNRRGFCKGRYAVFMMKHCPEHCDKSCAKGGMPPGFGFRG